MTLVLFECGVEVGRIDRRHLMRRPMLADTGQVDERCDATSPEPREALNRLPVMVDAVARGWLRRIDAGQSEVVNLGGLRGPNGRHPAPCRAHGIEIEKFRSRRRVSHAASQNSQSQRTLYMDLD
jgi:hypothetical protein